MRELDPRGTTPGTVEDDGKVIVQVPNKKLARLVQLGVHQERAARMKQAHRKATRESRRRNRSK